MTYLRHVVVGCFLHFFKETPWCCQILDINKTQHLEPCSLHYRQLILKKLDITLNNSTNATAAREVLPGINVIMQCQHGIQNTLKKRARMSLIRVSNRAGCPMLILTPVLLVLWDLEKELEVSTNCSDMMPDKYAISFSFFSYFALPQRKIKL